MRALHGAMAPGRRIHGSKSRAGSADHPPSDSLRGFLPILPNPGSVGLEVLFPSGTAVSPGHSPGPAETQAMSAALGFLYPGTTRKGGKSSHRQELLILAVRGLRAPAP